MGEWLAFLMHRLSSSLEQPSLALSVFELCVIVIWIVCLLLLLYGLSPCIWLYGGSLCTEDRFVLV